ncbi:hypothetical protein PV328_009496 [Microctonus aethiopoides]|uniref:Tetratricopeptide repeat protein 29 n=1 Tax=Microctonus aethiopoides TaxID=144406 RepID=A0AA39C5X2_9HYME|nr:hypothetical protein PV328_009496 [Microctonus aethiopoides]
MSRLDKPGWSACEELKDTSMNGTIKCFSFQKGLTRATKKDIDQVKKNLKEQLPVLTSTGIRRHRLPYHECVLLELKEMGMTEVADYIDQLFKINETVNNEQLLKLQRNFIDILKNNLIKAEMARRKNNYLEETTTLYDTAMFFRSFSHNWLWVVDELLKKALMAAEKVENDDGLTINTVKFIHGKFIFHYMKDPARALNYLNEVSNASKDKIWNTSKFLKQDQVNLHKECNILLYEIHHLIARKFRSINPKMVVKSSLEALKCANKSENNKYIVEALYELGESQMASDDMTGALKTFAKFLAKVKRIPDHKGICDAYKQLAIAHQNLKHDDGTREHLRLFRECASEYNLSNKLGEAHYLTGKYLLELDLPSEATVNLKIAFDMFKSLKMMKETDESRFLLGISKGEEVFEEYMKLILNCGNNDRDATLKLLQWKNSRVPFWTTSKSETDNENVEPYMRNEVETILLEVSKLILERGKDENRVE